MNKTSIDLSTVEKLNEFFDDINFDYDYGCLITVYTNKRQLHDKFYSNQFMPNIYLNENYYKRGGYTKTFNTPNQYIASLEYWMRDFKSKNKYAKYPPAISFIEVHHKGEFIARHFIRNGQIVGVVSYEHDRDKCPYIRSKIVADKPTLDWNRIMSDSFWGDKGSLRDYLIK